MILEATDWWTFSSETIIGIITAIIAIAALVISLKISKWDADKQRNKTRKLINKEFEKYYINLFEYYDNEEIKKLVKNTWETDNSVVSTNELISVKSSHNKPVWKSKNKYVQINLNIYREPNKMIFKNAKSFNRLLRRINKEIISHLYYRTNKSFNKYDSQKLIKITHYILNEIKELKTKLENMPIIEYKKKVNKKDVELTYYLTYVLDYRLFEHEGDKSIENIISKIVEFNNYLSDQELEIVIQRELEFYIDLFIQCKESNIGEDAYEWMLFLKTIKNKTAYIGNREMIVDPADQFYDIKITKVPDTLDMKKNFKNIELLHSKIKYLNFEDDNYNKSVNSVKLKFMPNRGDSLKRNIANIFNRFRTFDSLTNEYSDSKLDKNYSAEFEPYLNHVIQGLWVSECRLAVKNYSDLELGDTYSRNKYVSSINMFNIRKILYKPKDNKTVQKKRDVQHYLGEFVPEMENYDSINPNKDGLIVFNNTLNRTNLFEGTVFLVGSTNANYEFVAEQMYCQIDYAMDKKKEKFKKKKPVSKNKTQNKVKTVSKKIKD